MILPFSFPHKRHVSDSFTSGKSRESLGAPPSQAPLSNHVVRAPPPSFLSSYDVLGNTIDTPDCVSLFECKKLKVILKKKKNTKKNLQKNKHKKISFLGQSFLQVLMNIFLNPYKFYVFNIS